MTPRQARFVDAYLHGPTRFNATRSAEAAGYKWPGKQGPALLTDPRVKAAVEKGFEPILRESERGMHLG